MRRLLEILNTVDVNDRFIVEGLNVREFRGKYYITLTDAHNKGVDFSLLTNPTKTKINGHDVISIFKRTKLKSNINKDREFDGNPLLYALKNDPKYILDITQKDVIKYIRRFKNIVSEIKSKYDTIIITQSSHKINNWFMRALNNEIACNNVIEDYFIKVDGYEIWDDFDYVGFENALTDEFGHGNKWTNIYNKVIKTLEYWNRTDDVQLKSIPSKYRKFIKTVVTINDEYISDIDDKIDGKDILILDDTISSGKTISNSADIILKQHNPKSVTLITLFSGK